MINTRQFLECRVTIISTGGEYHHHHLQSGGYLGPDSIEIGLCAIIGYFHHHCICYLHSKSNTNEEYYNTRSQVLSLFTTQTISVDKSGGDHSEHVQTKQYETLGIVHVHVALSKLTIFWKPDARYTSYGLSKLWPLKVSYENRPDLEKTPIKIAHTFCQKMDSLGPK